MWRSVSSIVSTVWGVRYSVCTRMCGGYGIVCVQECVGGTV